MVFFRSVRIVEINLKQLHHHKHKRNIMLPLLTLKELHKTIYIQSRSWLNVSDVCIPNRSMSLANMPYAELMRLRTGIEPDAFITTISPPQPPPPPHTHIQNGQHKVERQGVHLH